MHITEVSFDCNRQDTAGINCVASTQASGCEEREEAHGPVVSSTCNLSISINLLSKMTNAHHKLQEAVSQKLTGGLNTKFIYEDNEKSRLNQEISRCGSSQVTRHILTTCLSDKCVFFPPHFVICAWRNVLVSFSPHINHSSSSNVHRNAFSDINTAENVPASIHIRFFF